MADSFRIRELKNTEGWAKQILYWRTHLDVFIEEYFKIKLKDVQKVIARSIGNCDTIYLVKNRGFGKTWLTALCCLALGVLYPCSKIAVVSGTAEQAVLVMKKISDDFASNPEVLREIDTDGRKPVSPLTKNKGICRLKNGSEIESFSLGTFRGNRPKIIVVDEAPEVKKAAIQEIVSPARNTTRQHCIQLGLHDYTSKMISITSACLKTNYFYTAFRNTLVEMAHGNEHAFACALDYKCAVRVGITPAAFFEKEKKNLSEAGFSMEYGSIFLGAALNTVFPFELTDRCRNLVDVETAMPVKSVSRYVMGLDLATSSAKLADNSAITILKLNELEDGSMIRRLVYLRTFHGTKLDVIANEVRKLLVKFPHIDKIIFDHRGLGDAFPQFMSQSWVDSATNKEYPPLVNDTEPTYIPGAVPLLHPFMATNALNQAMVSALTVALERGSIYLPVSSRRILGNVIMIQKDSDDEEAQEDRPLTKEEKAIFIETDGLQVEMGNIVAKVSPSGSVLYDTLSAAQHKDRYSSLAMANYYVSEWENYEKARILSRGNDYYVGMVSTF